MTSRRACMLIAAVLLGGAGCTDDPAARSSATSIDISNHRDAAVAAGDAGPDAHPAADAAVSPACLTRAACSAAIPDCRATWDQVLADPICRSGTGSGQTGRESRGSCAGYQISWITFASSSTAYYYDAQTGALAAIYTLSLPHLRLTCSAGPPAGLDSDCLDLVHLTTACPADAGGE